MKETALEEVQGFTYLGSIVNKNGATEGYTAACVGKARAAFRQPENVRRQGIYQ